MAAGLRDRRGRARSPPPLISPQRLTWAPGGAALGLLAIMPLLATVRAALLAAGVPDLLAGTAFAAAMIGLAIAIPAPAPGWRRRLVPGLAAGALLGALLLLPGVALGPHLPQAALNPAAFPAWMPATAMVVLSEELFLRARLQPLLGARIGPSRALWLSAIAFALAHVPLYGASALPLDLGVGLLVGCLRQWSGRVAPAMLAHGIADFGWWFLG